MPKYILPMIRGFCCLSISIVCLGMWLSTVVSCGSTAEHQVVDDHVMMAQEMLLDLDQGTSGEDMPLEVLDRLNLQVRTIFAHRCYQCHSTSKHKGALVLDTKEGVYQGGDSGPLFEVGRSGKSEIVRRLTLRRSHEDVMPPKGKSLAEAEIEVIRQWIDLGAHWTDEALKIFPEAPLALSKPALPNPDTYDHPIDRWVDQYFAQHDLAWPEIINDRRFVRRLYLDLVGLLPPDSVIQAFERDVDPNKTQKLVAQLLASEEDYTLHWLSFWNDLLRNDYSGTGYITGGRKQITDWLYRAIREDKGYDKFARQLINPTEEAEGFIQGIKWRGAVNASQRTELQAAQNIAQTFLGLNLKCASCHNSFVNNVTLQQAYDFASVFADTTLELYRCDKPTGNFASPGFLYPELGPVVGEDVKERLASLAEVVVQPENGRLYRTVVNRYWAKLFGRGIVSPVDAMDNRPWQPELLDWLTADFMEQGYSLKKLLATIVTSRAYRLKAHAYPSPAYVQSSQFMFRGPTPRRLTAEQFVDALSEMAGPVYRAVAYDPGGRSSEAKWIWHHEMEFERTVLPKPGKRFFRKVFQIAKNRAVSQAKVVVTADHSYQLRLNGELLLEGADWQQAKTYDIAIDQLTADNILTVVGTNDGAMANPAGLLLHLRIKFEDGAEQHIYSDKTWRTTDSLAEDGWQEVDYDDSDWSEARAYGSFRRSHWGQVLSFRLDGQEQAYQARAAIVTLDPFMKTLGRPVRENVSTERATDATLLESLLLSNDAFFAGVLSRGAQRWLAQWPGQESAMIEAMYMKALGRLPTEKEKKVLGSTQQDGQANVEDILWSLVLLPEFQFI